jgi:hypothetical protein
MFKLPKKESGGRILKDYKEGMTEPCFPHRVTMPAGHKLGEKPCMK